MARRTDPLDTPPALTARGRMLQAQWDAIDEARAEATRRGRSTFHVHDRVGLSQRSPLSSLALEGFGG